MAAATAGVATVTAERQEGDPASMLSLYRAALELRRAHPALGDGALAWLEAPPAVLAFRREPGLVCVVNLADAPVPLPVEGRVLLGSVALTDDRQLPGDAAVWLEETAPTGR